MRIDTYEGLVEVLNLQNANLPTYQTQVDAKAEDLREVDQDHANLVYLDNLATETDAVKRTIFQIKQQSFNGDPQAEISPFPVFPTIAAPFNLVAGCLERAKRRNRRFKAAAGYTKEIGIALGLEDESQSISPETVKPSLDVSAANSDYLFAVVISNRAKSDSWDVLVQRTGEDKWTVVKTATGKSADINVTPSAEGKTERIKVRVQLRKNNQNYGQPSDIAEVTVNP